VQSTVYLTVKQDDLFVGNGETCQRLTNQGVEQHPCPSPDLCPLAQGGNCKPYGRLHVNLDESDELGTFIFRTTGFSSIDFGSTTELLPCSIEWLAFMPTITTDLRGKSTTQSYRTPVYYVDLTLRDGFIYKRRFKQPRRLIRKVSCVVLIRLL
jgi:hypothetical protein